MYDATEKMLGNGVIQLSTSAWAANALMVPKPSDPLGGLRYVVDYRYLNRFCVADSGIIHRVGGLLGSLAGAEVFSMMDCAAGFWGVEIKPEHRHLTAFNTWTHVHGQMEFVWMSFGLRNDPSCSSWAMSCILHPFTCGTCPPRPPADPTFSSGEACAGLGAGAGGGAVAAQTFQATKRIASLYVDGACVHASTDSHVDGLASVLKRQRGSIVSLKMVKCEFGLGL